MTSAPLVSVIMPYYDHVHFLVEAVNSVVGLDHPEVELIVVDDCSPGKTAAEILENHSFKRIKIVRHDVNKGHVASKNTGIENANGQFILPLDSDDLIDSTFLKETLPLIYPAEKSNVGVVFSDVHVFGDQDYVYTPAMTKLDFVKLNTPSNTFLVRKSVYDQIGLYDATMKFGDESDFLLRVLENDWQIAHVRKPLYEYRRHGAGLSYGVKYPKLLADMIDRHPETFRELLKDALLHREERYWDEQGTAAEGETGSADNAVIQRQYQHLHKEFHKLLAEYNKLKEEYGSLQKSFDELSNGRYYRIRNKINSIFKSLS